MNDSDDDTLPCADIGEPCDLTHSDMLPMLKMMRKFAIQKDESIFPMVEKIKQICEQNILKNAINKKQTTLDSFFTQ